jgi:chitin disaccharide deacetylase
LLIRTDDAGMSHSVNVAIQRLIATGLPVSVSVMFPTPWYQETVAILQQHPEVSVGIHLTLNSEWKHYRWGPVAGRSAVPSLVDTDGYFFSSASALYENSPDMAHVETELRAQLERARSSGLRIDYVDAHMGTVWGHPGMREIAERLAREYGLGISQYFGERMTSPQYSAPPAQKLDSLVALVDRLEPGVTVVITHVGIDGPELGALVDMNTANPLPEMAANRQGELTALTSARFRESLRGRNIQLTTYRQVIEKHGLKSMRRPGG